MSRAHSFPWTILSISLGQFAKFRGSPWQNCPNYAAYRGLPFVREQNFILLKKLQFLEAEMALIYASNIQRKLSISYSFQKCN